MAKKTEDDAPRKKSAAQQVIVWGFMAMLVVGLGGFGVANFGGGVTAIGSVGKREIDVNDYARALQQQLNQLKQQFGQNITLTQAQAFGLDQQVLQGLLAQAALDNEADRIGLSVGDATVASKVTEVQAFKGLSGTFDRETYRFALKNANMTEAKFEDSLRYDEARALLQGAVSGGFVAPAALTDTLYAYVGERRAFSLLRLSEADLTTPLATPDEAELKAFYDANIAQFTAPEAKRITYAALLPENIAADQKVDEAALKKAYEDRIDEFVQPEKRLVERLVYPTQAEAEAAKAKLDSGTSFETLVKERGLELNDIDLGDVTKDQLGKAGDAVFGLAGPGVVGPFDSDLGPALFRMNGILAAQETSFEQAKPDLATEAQTDAARRAISDRVEAIDDLLAGGATLEDLAKEQKMTLTSVDYVPSVESPEGIAAYPAFRKAADALAEGDFPEAVLLDDGGLVAMRLDKIVPPAPIPFEAAKDKVATAWRADALSKALSARAVEIKSAVESGKSLASFGILDRTATIAREGTVENTPPELMTAAFAMKPQELRVIEGPGFTGILQLDAITPAATTGDDANALKGAIATQVEQGISQDAMALFTTGLMNAAGITLDQTAINAVHAQFN
jgi:peptidyl-prolyl cis-trans isomerase D